MLIFIGAKYLDHVEGSNVFPSQPYEIEKLAPEQVYIFQEIILENVIKCSKLMEINKGLVNLYGVPGNHGKIKTKFAQCPADNWDTLIFMNLDFTLKSHIKLGQILQNVRIVYPDINIPREYLLFNIKGWDCLIQHILPPQFTTTGGEGKLLKKIDSFRSGR